MNKLDAIIVDDEKLNRDILEVLVDKHCPEVNIIGKASSAQSARKILNDHNVDIMFLDIAMPRENGFDLLESINEKSFSVVFITAYNHFAIRAIRANALDYILKPIDVEELKESVHKALQIQQRKKVNNLIYKGYNDNLDSLIREVNDEEELIRRISLPHKNGYSIYDLDDILYIEASNNYSIFYLKNAEEIIVAKTLKEYDEVLADSNFIRIHKSYLINLNGVLRFHRDDGITIEMKNGSILPVSRRRQSYFLERFNNN